MNVPHSLIIGGTRGIGREVVADEFVSRWPQRRICLSARNVYPGARC